MNENTVKDVVASFLKNSPGLNGSRSYGVSSLLGNEPWNDGQKEDQYSGSVKRHLWPISYSEIAP